LLWSQAPCRKKDPARGVHAALKDYLRVAAYD